MKKPYSPPAILHWSMRATHDWTAQKWVKHGGHWLTALMYLLRSHPDAGFKPMFVNLLTPYGREQRRNSSK